MEPPVKKKSTNQKSANPKRPSIDLVSKQTKPASGPLVPSGTDPAKSDALLPHERDESTGMTDGVPSEPVRQAYRDVSRGLQDTDRGPVAGRVYRKLKS